MGYRPSSSAWSLKRTWVLPRFPPPLLPFRPMQSSSWLPGEASPVSNPQMLKFGHQVI